MTTELLICNASRGIDCDKMGGLTCLHATPHYKGVDCEGIFCYRRDVPCKCIPYKEPEQTFMGVKN